MAPQETVTTEVTTEQRPTEAERAAAAAAEAEARAAQLTADAERNAAERIAAFEGRMAAWETNLQQLSETVGANSVALTDFQARSEAATAGLISSLESIQQRLQPPPEPPPQNLTRPPGAGGGNPPPPEEPKPPAARRAHRWI